MHQYQMWVSLAETHPHLVLWDSTAGFDTRFDAELGRTLSRCRTQASKFLEILKHFSKAVRKFHLSSDDKSH
jgi:hypothetical protein